MYHLIYAFVLSLVFLAYRGLCAKALYLICKITDTRTEPLGPPSSSHSNLVGLCAEGLLKTLQFKMATAYCGEVLKWSECCSIMPDFATPWTVACQAPLSVEFSRPEYWSGLPFPSPGDLPNPGIKPRTPALKANSLSSQPSTPGILDWSNRTEGNLPLPLQRRGRITKVSKNL